MPRGKPTQIIEHRISLSNWERDKIGSLVDAKKREANIEAGISGVKVLAVAGIGAGSVYVAYQGYLLGREIAEIVYNVADEAKAKAKKAKDKIVAEYEEQIGPLKEGLESQQDIVDELVKQGHRLTNPLKPIFKLLNPFD